MCCQLASSRHFENGHGREGGVRVGRDGEGSLLSLSLPSSFFFHFQSNQFSVVDYVSNHPH